MSHVSHQSVTSRAAAQSRSGSTQPTSALSVLAAGRHHPANRVLLLTAGLAVLALAFVTALSILAVGVSGSPAPAYAAPEVIFASPTTMTLFAGSPNPSARGQTVSWGYSLSIGGTCVSPTGTVSLREGTTVLNTQPVGTPLSYNGLSVGTHTTMNAVYNGDSNCTASTSPNISQTVNKANTTTILTTSPNPSLFGQYVTLTATVTAATGGPFVPTGIVNFKDGSIPIGTGFLDGSGVAIIAVCDLTVAVHSLTAVYGGDPDFNTSTSSAVSQTVNKDNTVTTVTSSVNPSVFGQTVTFSASVVGSSACSDTPTGTVTFKDGATTLSTQSLLSGSASFSIASLSVSGSPHSITAVYNGSAKHNTSTSSALSQTVNRANTTTTVSSSINPTVYGQSASFIASVSADSPGSGVVSGTVTFKDGGTTLCVVSPGPWSCNVTSLTVGVHTITADYATSTNFNSSTGTLAGGQTVNKADTNTTLATGPNPSVFGQTVYMTGTVSAVGPGAGDMVGTVTFYDNGTVLGTTAIVTPSFTATATVSSLIVGTHPITASYNGNSNFNGSTSSTVNQVVNPANTATSLTSSPNPSGLGQTVVFTATVATNPSSTVTPTGSVVFKDGPTSLFTGTLVGGVVTYSTSALAVGAHAMTAQYVGTSNFNSSTSPVYLQNVGSASTTTAIAQSSVSTVYGQPVFFTATVSTTGGTATGQVVFRDAGNPIGFGTLNGAMQAFFSLTTLSVGSHPSIDAQYQGDGGHSASTSSTIAHTVTVASSSTALASSGSPTVFGQTVYFTATVSPVAPSVETPTGNVDFKDGGVTFCSSAVNGSGQAFCNTSSLTVGPHSMTAAYAGDGNFSGSPSTILPHTVNKANTNTSVSSSANPSVLGNNVTFTANVTPVAPGAGTPNGGTVDFKDGVTTIGSGPVVAGSATFSTSALALGSHNITAVFNSNTNFNGSISPILVQVVNAAASTVDFSVVKTDSPDPVQAGMTITYKISVSNGASSGSATVTMTDTLPSQVVFSSFSAPGWACTTPAGQVICSRLLVAGGLSVITVVVTVPNTLAAGTILSNTATVAGGSGTTDNDPSDNTSTAQTTVYRTRRFFNDFDRTRFFN